MIQRPEIEIDHRPHKPRRPILLSLSSYRLTPRLADIRPAFILQSSHRDLYVPGPRIRARAPIGKVRGSGLRTRPMAFMEQRISQQSTLPIRWVGGGFSVVAQCFFKGAQPRPTGYCEYTFGTRLGGHGKRHLATIEGQLGKQDDLRIKCPLADKLGGVTGPGLVTAEVSVYEAGSGRVTKASGHQSLRPSGHLIGLKTNTTEFEVGQPVKIHGVLLSRTEALVKGTFNLGRGDCCDRPIWSFHGP